jgi:hypothetical protein
MFGAVPSITWTITYVKNATTYYLSEISSEETKYVWSRRKEKAKRYLTEPSAAAAATTIKSSHKNKKLEIKVTQV